jgi:hypothetical protein
MSLHKNFNWSGEPNARVTGVVYLLYFLTAVLAQTFVSWKLVFYGNAVNVIAYAFYTVLTLLFYFMFKPVNRMLSLLAALFSLAGTILGILDLFDLAPPKISPLLFFGPYCLLIGFLILRATFLPRFLGWLMMLAGLGWLAFLYPPIASHLSLYIEILGVVAEALLMFWLLVKGVNVPRWKEQQASAASIRA